MPTPEPPETPIPTWRQTELWREICLRASGAGGAGVKGILEQDWCLDKAEKILHSGKPPKESFTLHDEGHSFRVAERMAELCRLNGVLETLSPLELALLLLSAYLHDIGMTPSTRHVERYERSLRYGLHEGSEIAPADRIDEAEQRTLQKWLDEAQYPIDLSQPPARPGPDHDRTVAEIMLYFCRDRHNDWSEAWVRQNFTGENGEPRAVLARYPHWLESLVALCRSHHEGHDELTSKRFDIRDAGPDAHSLNLRYLACLLRLADILEMDPERTPKVLLKHHDVVAGSLPYWYKDHVIAVSGLDKPDRADLAVLRLSAEPADAIVHHAVRQTFEQIDDELHTCSSLSRMPRFDRAPGGDERRYPWRLRARSYANITPRGGYDYVDGAFRPNTRKVLELLSGLKLYGNEMAGVRELLQNAFDAVKQRIAYRRLETLERGEPCDPRSVDAIRHTQHVHLRLETEPQPDGTDRLVLVCDDDGIGMTKDIIAKHLLVSGAPVRHQVLDLERRCRKHRFSCESTGRFGIGVLSYFMLADRLTLETRRSQEAPDGESAGWRFTTHGIGSFGELNPIDKTTHATCGTRVALRLQPRFDDPEAFVKRLHEHLDDMLCRLPCRLTFTGPGDAEPRHWNPGWTDHEEAIRQRSLGPKDDRRTADTDRLLSQAQAQAAARSSANDAARHGEMSAQFKLMSADEGEAELPDGMGYIRVRRVVWNNEHGQSLLCYWPGPLSPDGDTIDLHPGPSTFGGATLHADPPRVRVSWRGMRLLRVVGPDNTDPTRRSENADQDWAALITRSVDRLAHVGQVIDVELIDPPEAVLSADRTTLHLDRDTQSRVIASIGTAMQQMDGWLSGELEHGVWRHMNLCILGQSPDVAEPVWLRTRQRGPSGDPHRDTRDRLQRFGIDDTARVSTSFHSALAADAEPAYDVDALSTTFGDYSDLWFLSKASDLGLFFYPHPDPAKQPRPILEGCFKTGTDRPLNYLAPKQYLGDCSVRADLPSEWHPVSVVRGGDNADVVVLNRADEVSRARTADLLSGYRHGEKASTELKDVIDKDHSPGYFYGLIMSCGKLSRYPREERESRGQHLDEQWRGIKENAAADFFPRLFAKLERPEDRPFRMVYLDDNVLGEHEGEHEGDHPALLVFELNHRGYRVVKRLRDPERFAELVPIPAVRTLDSADD